MELGFCSFIEYGSEPDGNFLEAAEAADTTDPAESGSDTLILAVMLGIVGCVCAGALTALIATRSAKQKAKKKRGDKGATDEGAKEEAAGASNAALSNDDKSHFNSASASTPATPVAAAVLEVPSLLAAPREAVTPSLPSDIHAAGEEGHGDGTMNTTATDLQMDPNYKYGRNSGTIQPEYPLAMTAEELDELFAPYYIAHATRSELFANKKSLRSKKAPGLIKHRASEAHFTFEDIVNQLEDGQLPTDAKPSYTYQTKSKYVEKPRLNRKLSDPQHTERTKAELKTAHSDSIVNLAQGETILNRELTGQKLKKARLRQKKKENLQRQTRLQKADNPLQSVLIRRNKPTRPEESSSMSLPGSVLEQQSSETLLPLRTKHVQRRYEQGKTTLAKKSKKRTRRHMHELSDLQSTLMDDQLISPS
ncbi:uncharacterized protein [Watersipora subatra]|uniref:uncharacterized protein n=1 Tax=Watersipora subatra TaxID=2589382 RepID=UPI00355C952C